MSLAEMYVESYLSEKEEKTRDPKRLFVTDIGKCPRQIAYRMLETEPDDVDREAYLRRQIMFELAEHMEYRLFKALGDKVVSYQENVDLPWENWGGRIDIIADYGGERIIEVKTLGEQAMKKPLPLPTHKYQVSVYHKHKDLRAHPLLVYFNRGGVECDTKEIMVYDVEDAYKEALALVDELNRVRDNLPELPPKREKELKILDRGTSLKSVRHHDCGKCPYVKLCDPPSGSETWAKFVDGKWVPTSKMDYDKAIDFLDSIAKKKE